MAQPATFHVVARDGNGALRAQLQAVPEKHGEAILAACEILQELHDHGILEVLRGGLAASDQLLELAVASADTPETVRAIRNLLYWSTIVGRIEPEWIQGVAKAIPDGLALATTQRDQRASIWKVLRRAMSRDSLRGLTAAVDFLESFGRRLNALEHGTPGGEVK
jgi:uncharacterized protein YjgD (DUF1641 family)